MNKLMGFLELREVDIPSIRWKEFVPGTELSADKLWTIRCAKYTGKDIDLPKMVGKTAEECTKFAENLIKDLRDNGMVVYYPYFTASKSGTLLVEPDSCVIEAVSGSLWNLTSGIERDVTVISGISGMALMGDSEFFLEEEIRSLLGYADRVRSYFRDSLFRENVLLEWSIARDSDIDGNPVGDPYFVFYEIRSIKR